MQAACRAPPCAGAPEPLSSRAARGTRVAASAGSERLARLEPWPPSLSSVTFCPSRTPEAARQESLPQSRARCPTVAAAAAPWPPGSRCWQPRQRHALRALAGSSNGRAESSGCSRASNRYNNCRRWLTAPGRPVAQPYGPRCQIHSEVSQVGRSPPPVLQSPTTFTRHYLRVDAACLAVSVVAATT